jgi:transcription antitermination factor NusG
LCVPGVAYLLGSAKGPTPLGEDDVCAIRALTRRELCAEPYPYISVGQRVRVRSGALKDVEGVLVRKKDSSRLVISVDSIMRSVILEVDITDVDLIPLGVAA